MGRNGKGREVLSAEQETLEVKLNRDELEARSQLLGSQLGRLEELEAKEKAFKEGLKKERTPLDTEVRFLGRVIRRKTEPRPVLVETIADYERGVAIAIRTDTGEVIRERELSFDERQPTLIPMPSRRRTPDITEDHA